MKTFRLRTVGLFATAICLASATIVSAQNRNITANSLMLDNGGGNTLLINYTGIGVSTFNFPAGNSTATPTGTALGQILYWNTGTSTWTTLNTGAATAVLHGGVTPSYAEVALAADVSGLLPVANGGTNANSAAGARTNLGAAASGANTDITSLRGLVFGTQNTLAGNSAGSALTSGANNTMMGYNVGLSITSGFENTLIGSGTGNGLTTEEDNTFVGFNAGSVATSINGVFVGTAAGANTTSGHSNTFVGRSAGLLNQSGSQNAFIGLLAGSNNTTGNFNTALGRLAGASNTTESFNTFIGASSNGSAGIDHATAIGALATVTQSNSVILGNGADVGINTTAPRAALDVATTGAIIIPVGTTGQRPVTAVQGMIRFNTTSSKFEGYDGTTWVDLN